MSRVRGIDTSPEIAVRQILHRIGFRFRVHAKDVLGRPDIVNRKRKVAIFVHGCFWHCHQGCKYGNMPKSRLNFWASKLQANSERDRKHQRELKQRGWSVLVVWQCELKRRDKLITKIQRFICKCEKERLSKPW